MQTSYKSYSYKMPPELSAAFFGGPNNASLSRPSGLDLLTAVEAVGDGTGGHRNLAVQHRSAPSESFELEFQNGPLLECIASADIDALDIWISEREPESWFTRDEAEAMKDGETGMAKTKGYGRLKEMLDRGALEKRWSTEKKKEELRSREETAEQRAGFDTKTVQ